MRIYAAGRVRAAEGGAWRFFREKTSDLPAAGGLRQGEKRPVHD